MNINQLLYNLWREQSALLIAGGAFSVLFLVLTILSFFDSQQILGINRWVKPMKFASSIAIYLWTLAIYLYFLDGFQRAKEILAWLAISLLVGEIIIILTQSARGNASHFNVARPLDGILFGLMGIMIGLSTLSIIYLTWLYFSADVNLPTAVVWGMRWGLILFLAASFEGGYMAAMLRHGVGVTDGGAGLPFVNWSAVGGDLRVAHFVGMHALQVIPLASLAFVWLQTSVFKISPTIMTFVFALLYLSAFSFVFIQALQGKPLLALEKIQASGGL